MSTLNPLKNHNVLNLAVQNVFYVQLYMESAITCNPGSNFKSVFSCFVKVY